MKRWLTPAVALLLSLAAPAAFAQWQETATAVHLTDPAKKVGIGMSNPGAPLTITGLNSPLGLGLIGARSSIFLGSSDNYANTAYFGLQRAPSGFAHDFALVGSSDPGLQRHLHIGYNTAENPAGPFNARASINVFSGQAWFNGLVRTGPARDIGIGLIGGKSSVYLGTSDQFTTTAYFGLQRSPTGYAHDFAIVGSSDATQQRKLLFGYHTGDNPAQTFHSRAEINIYNGDATFAGTVSAANVIAKYQDLAEWVPASEEMAAGTVVVLDPEQANQVTTSSTAYDTTVAGVVSAAPGILLGEAGAEKERIATTGRVRVRVDATAAPIRIGDLLVTSGRRGMAMKSEPIEVGGRRIHQPGTIIGKALEPLAEGQGEILVLLSLQ